MTTQMKGARQMQYRGQKYNFDLGDSIGGGGMAKVYVGTRHDDPHIQVAIKIPDTSLDKHVQDLFLREAEAAQMVSSDYVVRVVDWGSAPPFIAFDYIKGETLAVLLQRRQESEEQWSELELIHMFRQLVMAMAAINKEVIHRDLKPANIFVDGDVLKVADFGIAKYAGEATRSRTLKGWGTLEYMAPEAFDNGTVDWRADQYSLGIVFYELATLRHPFANVSPSRQERARIFKVLPRVRGVRPDIAESLDEIVAHMLQPRVESRFQSWTNVLAALDAADAGYR